MFCYHCNACKHNSLQECEEWTQSEKERRSKQSYSEYIASRYKLHYCWICKEFLDGKAGDAHVKHPDVQPQEPCNHCLECDHDDLQECKEDKGTATYFHERKDHHLIECGRKFSRCPHCWFCFKAGHKSTECRNKENMDNMK